LIFQTVLLKKSQLLH